MSPSRRARRALVCAALIGLGHATSVLADAPAPPAPVAAPATAPANPTVVAKAADELRAAQERGEAIAERASGHVGAPYRFGGSSPAGFDCSGLVRFVYGAEGHELPRDLGGQLAAGRRVERSELGPGDVVFFQNTYRAGLSHAGIYLGDGQFVHAADERRGVVVSNVADGYWASRYVGASRPTG